MQALVVILCILGASAIRLPHSYLERKENTEMYPRDGMTQNQYDPNFGESFLGAFLFPDPNADHSVFDALAPCVNKTQLAITGFGNTLDGNCVFDFGDADVHTVAMKFHSMNCESSSNFNVEQPEKQQNLLQKTEPQMEMSKHAEIDMSATQLLSVCDIPRKVSSDTSIKVQVVQGSTRGAWHSIQTGWENGENNQLTAMPAKKYKLAATHQFKNSGPHITEWLEWHMARGIEHFFLYDNNSDESDRQYTLPYEKKGIVTRVKWEYCCQGPANNHAQRAQMNHALYKFGQVADWIVDIDNDEFISSSGQNIPDILAKVDPNVHIVGLQSRIMQPGCDSLVNKSFVENAGHAVHMLGAVPVTSDCMPQVTSKFYPGKYFVRTLGAYRNGFVELSPHPEQQRPRPEFSNALHLNHFRKNYVQQRTTSLLAENDPMVQRFADDWKLYSKQNLA